MPNQLTYFQSRTLARSTSRALDRTSALAASAIEDMEALNDAGSQARRNLLRDSSESQAAQLMRPGLSMKLELLDNDLFLAYLDRVNRLRREL